MRFAQVQRRKPWRRPGTVDPVLQRVAALAITSPVYAEVVFGRLRILVIESRFDAKPPVIGMTSDHDQLLVPVGLAVRSIERLLNHQALGIVPIAGDGAAQGPLGRRAVLVVRFDLAEPFLPVEETLEACRLDVLDPIGIERPVGIASRQNTGPPCSQRRRASAASDQAEIGPHAWQREHLQPWIRASP